MKSPLQQILRVVGVLLFGVSVVFGVACGPQPTGGVLIPPTEATPQGEDKGQEDPSLFGLTFSGGTTRPDSTSSPAPNQTPSPTQALCIHRGGRCASSCPSGTQPLRGMADCARVGGICCAPAKPECLADADCGQPSCGQKGNICGQAIPFCYYGRCFRRHVETAGTCDVQMGLCGRPTPQCTNNQTCGQPRCQQSGSMCTTLLPLCNQGQCTSQKVTIQGTCQPATGTCQVQQGACQSDKECGKTSCYDQGTTCYQLQPACQNGQCAPMISRRVGSCNQQTGLCEQSQPGCRADQDCGQPTCKQDGASCLQYSPVCTNGACQSNASRLANQTCNSRTGLCDPKTSPTCQSDADCGKPTCQQNGTSCTAYIPTCRAGFCTSSPQVSNGTCTPTTGLCVASPQPSTCGMNPMEAEVLRLVNIERKQEGLAALTCHPALVSAARSWSDAQCQSGQISHKDFAKRVKATGIAYTAAGENVAAGQSTAAAVVNAWMNSTGHRANILSATFTHLGVGYFNCGSSYKHFWTQMFVKIN